MRRRRTGRGFQFIILLGIWRHRKMIGRAKPYGQNDAGERRLVTTGYHLLYNPELKAKARELRKNMTPAEGKLWYGYLKNFKYPVARQRPIGNYIVDFYCPRLKLVIEVDGDTHFFPEGERHDKQRTAVLESYGLRVMRFMNIDVLESFEGVCEEIESQVPLRLPVEGDLNTCQETRGETP